MIRKVVVFLMIATVLLAVVPVRSARADSDQVLLVYQNNEEMEILSDLIVACGKQVKAMEASEYSREMLNDYNYIVLQDNTPLLDALDLGKRVACVGAAFISLPGISVRKTTSATNAELNVYTNKETVTLDQGTSYITKYSGQPIGSVTLNGLKCPLCVESGSILYAPYLCADDLSAFAVAQMLNRYFNRHDGGKTFVMIDEVYPFDDLSMLKMTAKKLYENGMPFIVSVMPVYYNTEYPSFKRFVNVLRYIQSIGGSILLHAPLETGNELVGDPLEVRLSQAYQTFIDNGIAIYNEQATPYAISLDALSGMLPQNELFITLPIDTVICLDIYRSEQDLDKAIAAVNSKWLQIGDYRRYFTDVEYLDSQEEIDSDFQYREVAERRYAFLVDTGNQILFVIVIISTFVVVTLIAVGFRLYRRKFIKKTSHS